MVTKNTRILGTRVPDALAAKVKKRAEKHKRTVSEWILMVLEKELSR